MDIVYRSKALLALRCEMHFRTAGVTVHGVSAYRPADLAKMGWTFAADFTVYAMANATSHVADTVNVTFNGTESVTSPRVPRAHAQCCLADFVTVKCSAHDRRQ